MFLRQELVIGQVDKLAGGQVGKWAGGQVGLPREILRIKVSFMGFMRKSHLYALQAVHPHISLTRTPAHLHTRTPAQASTPYRSILPSCPTAG
jgi:hypothetical protein